MNKSFLGAVSTVALSVTAAHADGPTVDWSGPYIGANAGVAILDGTLQILDVFSAASDSLSLSETGLTFGGQLGWNFQHDQFVFGVEGDFNYFDADDRISVFTGKATIAARSDYDWFATLRGRVGVAMDETLFYVTGGIALLDSDLRVTDINGVVDSDSDVLFGGTIGGGIEHMFDDKWSAKAEYLYANFESHSVATPGAFGASAKAEPELHVIRIGINYRFCTGGAC